MSFSATRWDDMRRQWRPLELAAMILGFVLFWPLGLAILAWKGWKEGWWGPGRPAFAGASESRMGGCWSSGRDWRRSAWSTGWDARELHRNSGNMAFEDYKQAELKRLQEEFDRLVAEQKAFGDFLDNLRRAKDKAEFDQFVASRRQTSDGGAAQPNA
jgi:hypothetical protein